MIVFLVGFMSSCLTAGSCGFCCNIGQRKCFQPDRHEKWFGFHFEGKWQHGTEEKGSLLGSFVYGSKLSWLNPHFLSSSLSLFLSLSTLAGTLWPWDWMNEKYVWLHMMGLRSTIICVAYIYIIVLISCKIASHHSFVH